MLSNRQLEKIVKGFSNHRRIEILNLLHKSPNLSVMEICEKLSINYKTGSVHLKRLEISGLIFKYNHGAEVTHTLSSLGEIILMFLRTLE